MKNIIKTVNLNEAEDSQNESDDIRSPRIPRQYFRD